MSNIHLSIYPESKADVIKGVLDFIRANNFPYLYHQWFDTDDRENEAIVSSYEPDNIDLKAEKLGVDTFFQLDGIDDVCVDAYGMYRFDNGKYYLITI